MDEVEIVELKEEYCSQVTEIEKKTFSLPWSEKAFLECIELLTDITFVQSAKKKCWVTVAIGECLMKQRYIMWQLRKTAVAEA